MNPHHTRDPLVTFLYVLLRDHVTAGAVEEVLESHVEKSKGVVVLSNGYVAAHAEDIAARLRGHASAPGLAR